jgi:hypothetical protein
MLALLVPGVGMGGGGVAVVAATPQSPPKRRDLLPPLWVLPGVTERMPVPMATVRTYLVAGPVYEAPVLVRGELLLASVFLAPLVSVVSAPREQASGERRYHLEATIDDYQEIGMELAIRGKPELLAAVRSWKRAQR